jgi:hypothetical protein
MQRKVAIEAVKDAFDYKWLENLLHSLKKMISQEKGIVKRTLVEVSLDSLPQVMISSLQRKIRIYYETLEKKTHTHHVVPMCERWNRICPV